MDIQFKATGKVEKGTLVVFASQDKKKKETPVLSSTAKGLDDKMKGTLSKAIKVSGFKGAKGSMTMVLAPDGLSISRLIILGTGKGAELTPYDYSVMGSSIIAKLLTSGETDITIAFDTPENSAVDTVEASARVAEGVRLKSYRFDKYRTKEPKSKKPTVKKVTITLDKHKESAKRFAVLDAIASGVLLTRDLVSEPANILNPVSFAKRIKDLESDGIKVTTLGEAAMAKLGMGSLLSVGQGSAHESQLVIMQWNGGSKGEAPLAFVGKGVTFDTGGISLKPGAGMEQMKWDMGGAGTVVGLMKALAARKAKVNVVAIVGLVENMPSSTASRPGDVVTSMSGQTIEILNTDAEGRLVLADALWYCQDKYKPKFMIDLATLTGAIIVSLGKEHAGIFTDDDKLANALSKAGAETGDKVWRLPLHKNYDKLIDCDIADMKNIGGSGAGSITAAQFLKRFTNDIPWVHMDVAGTVWSDKDMPLSAKGGTGYGVKLLDHFISENYE